MTVLLVVLVIVIALLVALFGTAVVAFNKLRRADITAQEALGGIDIQLTRRADLIPALVAAVQGYATHERGVLDEVTAARTRVRRATESGSVDAKAAADGAMDRALGHLFAVAENYPGLAASQNFVALQRELAETENRLSFARQYHNDAVAQLNRLVRTIPWMVFSAMAGVRSREFYRASEEHREPPAVGF